MELTSDQLLALQRLGTCAVADAIEAFEVRLRNVGFADRSIRCWFPDFPAVVGFAVTARIRTAAPPMVGSAYVDRADWWSSLGAAKGPLIAVIEDVDDAPGSGALVGGVHGSILRALGVVAIVTNGAVRNLPRLRSLGLQCFAAGVVPSHGYAHVFEFGVPVAVGGLDVKPGDLIHGDQHGIVTIPQDIAARIPDAAAQLDARAARVSAMTASSEFSLDRLRPLLAQDDRPMRPEHVADEVSTDE